MVLFLLNFFNWSEGGNPSIIRSIKASLPKKEKVMTLITFHSSEKSSLIIIHSSTLEPSIFFCPPAPSCAKFHKNNQTAETSRTMMVGDREKRRAKHT